MLLLDRPANLLDQAFGELPFRLDRWSELSWLHRSELLDQGRCNRSCHLRTPFGSERVPQRPCQRQSSLSNEKACSLRTFWLQPVAPGRGASASGLGVGRWLGVTVELSPAPAVEAHVLGGAEEDILEVRSLVVESGEQLLLTAAP